MYFKKVNMSVILKNYLDVVVRKETKRFTQDGRECSYNIYESSGPPSILFGRPGDISVNGEVVWYRGNKEWEVSSQQVDKIGRPLQQHPVFKSKRRLEGLEWKAQSTWNTRKKRNLDEMNGIL